MCAAAPNAAGGMFALAAAWANSSAHFDIKRGTNAILSNPDFVSNDLERDLNFAFKPSSPAFRLGWEAIPMDQIGPDDGGPRRQVPDLSTSR